MFREAITGTVALLLLVGCASVKRDGYETMTGINASGYEYTTSTGLDVVVSRPYTIPGYSVQITNEFSVMQAYRRPDYYLLDQKSMKAARREENEWLERKAVLAAREAVVKHTGCEIETTKYNPGITTVRVTVKCGQ